MDVIFRINTDGTYSTTLTPEQYAILQNAVDKRQKQLDSSIRYAERKHPKDHIKVSNHRPTPRLRFVVINPAIPNGSYVFNK
jgi:hypothetical protein